MIKGRCQGSPEHTQAMKDGERPWAHCRSLKLFSHQSRNLSAPCLKKRIRREVSSRRKIYAYDFLYTLELVFSVAHFARKTDTVSSLHHETAFAEEADSILPRDLIALI